MDWEKRRKELMEKYDSNAVLVTIILEEEKIFEGYIDWYNKYIARLNLKISNKIPQEENL